MAEPTLKPIGDSLFVVWREPSVAPGTEPRAVLEFSRLAEHRDTFSAEVSVHNGSGIELHWARVNLSSTQGRHALIKALEARDPQGDWSLIVERSCRLVAKHVRTGEPAEDLIPEPPGDEQWIVEDLIARDQLNVLFGDGGTGKSYIALSIALAGLLRRPISHRWRVAPLKRVLYLDWECDKKGQKRRLWRLCEGLGSTPADGLIKHRRMARALLDDITAIRAEVAKHEIDLVIVDSLAPACGPEPETASAIIPALVALRSLGVTVLIIAHVSHQSAMSKAPARPFGSVFLHNLARITIELRRSEGDVGDTRTFVVSAYLRKNNDGPQVPPSAFQVRFEGSGAVTVTGSQPDSGGASLSFQILEALNEGRSTVRHLAEMLDATPVAVSRAIQRLSRRDMVVEVGTEKVGRNKEKLWGRADGRHDMTPRQPGDDVVPSEGDDALPF